MDAMRSAVKSSRVRQPQRHVAFLGLVPLLLWGCDTRDAGDASPVAAADATQAGADAGAPQIAAELHDTGPADVTPDESSHFALLQAGADPHVRLRSRLTRGARTSLRIVTKRRLTTEFEGEGTPPPLPGRSLPEQRRVLRARVLAVDSDGRATCEWRLGSGADARSGTMIVGAGESPLSDLLAGAPETIPGDAIGVGAEWQVTRTRKAGSSAFREEVHYTVVSIAPTAITLHFEVRRSMGEATLQGDGQLTVDLRYPLALTGRTHTVAQSRRQTPYLGETLAVTQGLDTTTDLSFRPE
jgi:hypothetical protein